MDDCFKVAIDFGGRNWLVWETEFKREMVGKMPTEMFFHSFKSFSDGANINIKLKVLMSITRLKRSLKLCKSDKSSREA
jgi:imidazoleglycerol phosphate dehydratase HisB